MRLIIRFGPVASLLALKFGCFFLLLLRMELVECQHHRGEITWTISKTWSCEDEQQLGCRCETSLLKPKPHTKITCSCENPTQVVHLHGSRGNVTTIDHETVWTIENCSNVTVHSRVLPDGAGQNFQLHFNNISSLQFREDAFELRFKSAPPWDTSITFNKCKIMRIPAKAFPSSLERVEFIESEIGSISSNSFKQLYMNELIFRETSVSDIEPNAFYQDLVQWVAKNSTFKLIQTNSITGGIRNMSWSGCVIEVLKENSINALIGHSVFEESHFYHVESNGLTIKEWTSLSFINNTFHRVNKSAIDLTQRSDAATLAVIKGNVWHEPSPNFIKTGQVESVIASVQNNTFMEICECGKTFTPMVTNEGSKQWFVKELLRNSRCPISEKATECLERNDTFLFFDELDLLCEAYACMQDLEPVNEIFTPQLPNRLRILAIFIGTLAGAIIVSLLVTMCVYMIRRSPSPKRNETSDAAKALGSPHDFSDVVYQISQAPSLRPRSALFEDVEMEDKCVQTMPNELSTDVLEGLREKLSRPDSFWDAKETIDHLYGLIQVREQSGTNNILSSPPDVTMCNTKLATPKYPSTFLPPPSNNHNRELLKTSSLSHPQPRNSRYALNNGKPIVKPRTTTLCEYRDPSDSQVHIYSELNQQHQQHHHHPSNANQTQQPSQPQHFPPHRLNIPVLCEYNEPKDVQTHIYAELTPKPSFILNDSASTSNPHHPPSNNHPTSHGEASRPIPVPRNVDKGFSSRTIQRPLPEIPPSSVVP